jgi:hypothetical protein
MQQLISMNFRARKRAAWAVCATAIILPIRAGEPSLPVREVTSDAMLVPNQDVPGFHRGYVYFIERSRITLYSPDGRLALTKEIQRPNQRPLSVIGIAVDRDGTLATSWSQFPSADGKFAGIDLIDAAGKPVRTIETGAYLAGHLAFDDEHSIWAFGWQRDPNRPERASDEYMAVRKYSSDGRLLASYLPRSLFPRGLQPACANWQERRIQVARDRIGLLACSGMTSGKPEWVELDLNGNVTGRWTVEFTHTVTMTDDGHVYAQNANSKARQVLMLDRNSSTFAAVDWQNTGTLYGADNNELVFGARQLGPIHFSWYKQPR